MDEALRSTIASNIGEVVRDIYAGTKALVGRNAAAFQNEIESGFNKLVTESYQRRSMVKTLLDGNEPVPLREYYVPVRLSMNEKIVSEGKFLSHYFQQKRVMIVGTAGAGKSMFMKRLFLLAVEAPKGPIPIFIELRSINDTTFTLFDLILDAVQNYIPKFSSERLRDALHRGKFSLFLDGIDEIDPSKRDSVCAQLVALTQKNRALSVLSSSRPDSRFQQWEEFFIYTVCGLPKTSVLELISRVRFAPDLKGKFKQEVVEPKYEQHEEFLSIPLLAIMMLIVYGRFAEVPDKMANFYKRAFQTLFSEHDTSKGGYKRKSYCNLPMEDFERVFSAFCAGTYAANETTFKAKGIKQYIAKACQLESLTCDENDLLNDMMQSVCVIQQEGDEYVFVHRSFQEYFAAVFFCNGQLDQVQRRRVIKKISARVITDNVLDLMREIDPGKLEALWLTAACEEFFEQLGVSPRGAYPGFATMTRSLYQRLGFGPQVHGYRIRTGILGNGVWLATLLERAARGRYRSQRNFEDSRFTGQIITYFQEAGDQIKQDASQPSSKIGREPDPSGKGVMYVLDFNRFADHYTFLETTKVGRALKRIYKDICELSARLEQRAKTRDEQTDDLMFG